MIIQRFVLIAALSTASMHAAVNITSFLPSLTSPQAVGTAITWTAVATNSTSDTLAFQYSVAFGSGSFSVVRDFYPGTKAAGSWTGPLFTWQDIAGEGTYTIQVIAKDFTSLESASTTATFILKPISTGGSFVVTPTSNPLVALASAPACPAKSYVRLTMQKVGGTFVTKTNWKSCTPRLTTNIYAAGMYPSKSYIINYQVATGSIVVPGSKPVTFTAGPLPSNLTFPTFDLVTPGGSRTDQADEIVLYSYVLFGSKLLPAATNRDGNILWYYDSTSSEAVTITRPLTGGNMLTYQDGNSWNPNVKAIGQFLREIDLSGNTVRETNIGILQQQLMAMNATDFGPCGAIHLPAAVGSACLDSIHHDAIRLANGYTIVNVDIEKIFPPGTQGDTTGLNVDILGDGFIVLDTNFQVLWYFDTFQHAGGAPQLDINRPATLGETCASHTTNETDGCGTLFLVGTPGVTTVANDWLHQNCLYYDPVDGDLIVSSRHQDWLYKVQYQNGAGNGDILWRMGVGGDFTFNNTNDDPYPWFSHQHDAGIENTSTNLMTVYDNGNTRIAPPPIGLGTGNSRGMAFIVDESNMTVTPVLSQGLGYFGYALGSAQLLSNGNYFFLNGLVTPPNPPAGYAVEVLPTAGTVNGSVIWNLQSSKAYRAWLMPDMYAPPTT